MVGRCFGCVFNITSIALWNEVSGLCCLLLEQASCTFSLNCRQLYDLPPPRWAPSANRGAIIAYYCNFNILYALWHYYSLLWRYNCNYCFANVHTIIHYYCIISKKTIIALMAILLFHLLFSAYIIAIIAIITLSFTLLLTRTIITIMFFEKYYCNYCFPSRLLEL